MKFEEKLKKLEKNMKNEDLSIIEEFSNKFPDYFNNYKISLNNDLLLIDECLFRDFLRSDPKRYIILKKVRFPFEKSKYSVNNLKKTFFIYNQNEKNYEGPFSSYEMDKFIKKRIIKENTEISWNKKENINIIDFIRIVYPLPVKNKDGTFKFSNEGYKKISSLKNDLNSDTDSLNNDIFIKKINDNKSTFSSSKKEFYEKQNNKNKKKDFKIIKINTNKKKLIKSYSNRTIDLDHQFENIKDFCDDEISNEFNIVEEANEEDEYSKRVTKRKRDPLFDLKDDKEMDFIIK